MDRYAKTVLTVIAAALVWLCLKPVASPVYADFPESVRCELPDVVDVNIGSVGGVDIEKGVVQVHVNGGIVKTY